MGTTKKRPFGIIVALAAGLALGGGGVFLATRARTHAHDEQAAQAPKYHCPMHPTYTADKPGECPICGMKLVPIEEAKGPGSAPEGKRKIAFYRSPMNPSQTSPTPRKDEMGMDYVPVYEDEISGGAEAVSGLATVTIDVQRQQLIGMRTATATVGPVGTGWRTVGRVAVDETRVRRVNVKVDGFVEKLFVDYTGKAVRKGEPLLSIYSPVLLSAQSEYLLAVQTRDRLRNSGSSAGEELVAAARRRLELWDIPRSEIAHLEHGGEPLRTLTLYSPISGVVTQKNVVQGSKIAAGDMPFEITDLSEVWVLADAYELDFRRVRVGLQATFTLEALPGRKFQGRVTFIQPVLDPATRTAKLRLSFANPAGELRPDMFGDVSFDAKPLEALRVPFDAVIDSGEQKVVFVALGEGRFQPRSIQTGAQSSDWVEVTSGLDAGEQVVTRANFLIDSESRLKAALAALAKPKQQAAPAGKTPEPASSHPGHGK